MPPPKAPSQGGRTQQKKQTKPPSGQDLDLSKEAQEVVDEALSMVPEPKREQAEALLRRAIDIVRRDEASKIRANYHYQECDIRKVFSEELKKVFAEANKLAQRSWADMAASGSTQNPTP